MPTFAWCAFGDAFDPATHGTVEGEPRSLTVTCTEDEVPTARVEVPRDAVPPLGAALACWISEEDDDGVLQPVFHGRLTGSPAAADALFVTLEFVGGPEDMAAARAAAVAPLRTAPVYDPLFHDEGAELDPVEVLDGTPRVFDVDPVTGAVATVPLLGDGEAVIDEALVDGDSWSESVTGDPLPWVDVDVEAQWLQRAAGEVDVGAMIHRQAGGCLVTLSRSAEFAECWPAAGASLGDGWTVLAGGVEPQLRAGGVWPEEGFPIRTGLMEYVILPRQTYRPVLLCRWELEQRRVERLVFRVPCTAQAVSFSPPQGETIQLRLRDVTQPGLDGSAAALAGGAASFFCTPRGRAAAEHALCVGTARLAHALRCLRVAFRLPGWPRLDLRTRQAARLVTVAATGGWVAGKIVSLVRTWSESEWHTEVTLAVSVGTGPATAPPAAADPYAEDVWLPGYAVGDAAPQPVAEAGGAVLEDYAAQHPTDLFAQPATLTPEALVTGIAIVNQAPAQRVALREPCPSYSQMTQRLYEVATGVTVELLPVRPETEALHAITATVAPAYSLPAGIDLGA